MSDLEIHPTLARRRREKKQRTGGKAFDPTIDHLRDLRAAARSAPSALAGEPDEEPSRDREGDIRAETEAYDEAVKNDALDAAYEPDPVVLDVPDENV